MKLPDGRNWRFSRGVNRGVLPAPERCDTSLPSGSNRIVVYVSFDPDLDEAYVHYGDEDRDIVVALLREVLERLTGAVPEGAG